MSSTDFDKFSADYDLILKQQLDFFDKDTDYFAKYKVQTVKSHLTTQPRNILEFGCGTGRNLNFLKDEFSSANIFGSDISADSIIYAADKYPTIRFLNGDELFDYQNYFDLVFISCVIHHIEIEDRITYLSKLFSVMHSPSELFIFEHNPYNLVTRHLVNTCPFDEDAVLLSLSDLNSLLLRAGFQVVLSKYSLFFPSRFAFLRKVEGLLGKVPLGGQYFVKAIKP